MSSELTSELSELLPEKSTQPRQGVGVNVRRLLKLRGLLMTAVFLGIFVPAAAAIFLFVPRYFHASAELEFKEVLPGILRDEARQQRATYDSFVNTQIRVIEGYALRVRVLQNAEVRNNTRLGQRDDGLYVLASRLDVDRIPNTELVTLGYRSEHREEAILVLNAVVREYMDMIMEQELNRGGTRRRVLAEREEALAGELEALQTEVIALRRAVGLPAGEMRVIEPAELETYRLGMLNAEGNVSTARAAVRQAEKQIEQVDTYRERYESSPLRPIYAFGIEERVAQNPSVIVLSEQLATVQQELTVLEDRYVDDAPQVRVKRRERDVLAEQLRTVQSEVRGELLSMLRAQYELELAGHEATVTEAIERRDRFAALLDNHRQATVEVSESLSEIDVLERRIADTRGRLDRLREELFTIDVESNAPARVAVQSEASADYSPSQRERIRFLLVALLGSVLLSVMAGVTRESTDQTIRSGEDLAYISQLPLLAAIPHASDDRLPANVNVPALAAEYPNSMTADEFRRTAGRILNVPGFGEMRSTLIVSPTRGDGKTTLACNLAIVLAQAERRVLLVDVDSRNPNIERAFGLRQGPGLVEMLSGEALEHDPDRATEFDNLFVLGPGLRSKELVELLASREMRDFLGGAEELFDHVIIDTPASLLMAESRLLAPLVDGVVVVVGAGVSSFGMVRRCLRTLEDIGGKLAGIVVNGVKAAPLGYMKGNLDKYYAQGRDGGSAPAAASRRRNADPPDILLVKGSDEER